MKYLNIAKTNIQTDTGFELIKQLTSYGTDIVDIELRKYISKGLCNEDVLDLLDFEKLDLLEMLRQNKS